MKLADIHYREELKHLALYGLIGVCGASLDFLIYWFLTSQGAFYQYANLFSVTCGITLNFFLNAKFNFKAETKLGKRFACFYSIGMGGWLLSALLLHLGIECLRFSPIATKLASIVVVTSTQFLLNRLVTFRFK